MQHCAETWVLNPWNILLSVLAQITTVHVVGPKKAMHDLTLFYFRIDSAWAKKHKNKKGAKCSVPEGCY